MVIFAFTATAGHTRSDGDVAPTADAEKGARSHISNGSTDLKARGALDGGVR